jgi:hypothetical protein
MRGDAFQSPKCACFYEFLSICLQQIGCVNVIGGLLCVIALGVSSPFDKVLQGMTGPEVPMVPDGLHFIFCFSFDKV